MISDKVIITNQRSYKGHFKNGKMENLCSIYLVKRFLHFSFSNFFSCYPPSMKTENSIWFLCSILVQDKLYIMFRTQSATLP